MMNKYYPLYEFLSKCSETKVVLSCSEIETILSEKLPMSAHKHKWWWSNNDKTHVQSIAWGEAGYKVDDVILGEKITFTKE